MEDPSEHLRLLSIGNYVFAALSALSACIGSVAFSFIGNHMTGIFQEADTHSPPIFFSFFFIMVCFSLLLSWGLAVCAALSGRYLAERRNYQFCLVIAVIECLFVPLGTLLGVFTLYVLMKDQVKKEFNAPPTQRLF